MAYRLPTDRRELASSPQAPSYLDDFLDQIESLPSAVKSIFQQIRDLDDRVATTLPEAETNVREAIARATTKGVALENVKRTSHDFLLLQASAAEFAQKKVQLATDARDRISAAVDDLDARLVEFEAQLRKEGRWPSADQPAAPELKLVPSRGGSHAPPTAPVRSPPPEPALARTAPGPRAAQKSRRRDAVTPVAPTTPRAAAMAAARAAEAAEAVAAKEAAEEEVAAKVVKDEAGDVVMDTGGEQAAIDTTPYCVCRNISSGRMIACEGKNCAIEWFHFECVGLKETPTGVWYCRDCELSMRRKSGGGRRKAA